MDVERRPLEDRIDLLEARSDALESEAVEMWERAEKAEAAIKRVRELWTTCSCDRCTTNHLAILRALDGGDDE